MEDETAGDPISGVKWTRKTLRKLSLELKRRGFTASRGTIGRLLKQMGYRLRVNRKRLTKEVDKDRDRQMRRVARQRKAFLKAGWPVISVDTKKRELVGDFRQQGRAWRRQSLDVLEYDYPSQAEGVAIPYAIYDVARNETLVVIGTSHQTAQFAGSAIRRWWMQMGRHRYGEDQKELLIEADCGGANGNRCWLWKMELQQLADEFGLRITVTHLPTGASKWNPVEHRVFCHLSANWAGEPLRSYELILKYIRTTKTAQGLRCRAYLDRKLYQTGLKIRPEQKSQINLHSHRMLPKWNYTIAPGERRM